MADQLTWCQAGFRFLTRQSSIETMNSRDTMNRRLKGVVQAIGGFNFKRCRRCGRGLSRLNKTCFCRPCQRESSLPVLRRRRVTP